MNPTETLSELGPWQVPVLQDVAVRAEKPHVAGEDSAFSRPQMLLSMRLCDRLDCGGKAVVVEGGEELCTGLACCSLWARRRARPGACKRCTPHLCGCLQLDRQAHREECPGLGRTTRG